MQREDKQVLIKEIAANTAITDPAQIESVLDHLIEVGALNLFWTAPNRNFTAESTDLELPQKFYMASPLFKGMVTYVSREGWVGYQDEERNVRIQASNKRQLAKKIAKYAK